MPETKVQIRDIQKIKLSSQIVEETLEGQDDPVKKYMTTVSFQFEGLPGQFDPVIAAMVADCPINVVFGSPQANLGEAFTKLGGISSMTISSGDKSVTLGRE